MLPIHFYHFKKSIEPRFSFIPTGNIYVNRLIRGLAYWRRTVSSTIQQNKTLVLADWTAQGWSSKKREQVIKKLYELLNLGFSIHAWQSGQIGEITKDNLVEMLKEPQILERMTQPAMRSDIEAVTINELPNVVKDQILILDDYQINGLLHPEAFTTPRELDIAEIIEFKEDLNQLLPILKNAIPPITHITDNVVTEQSYNILEGLRNSLPEIPIKTHFQSITLSNDIVSQLLSSKKASIEKRTIHLEQLQFLEDVTLNNISIENMERLLPLLPNIKKLLLLNCSLGLEFQLDDKTQFPLLEKIKLLGTKISAKNLQQVMSNAINLTSLVVDTSSSVSNNHSFSSLKLPNFNLIKFRKSVFTKENLQQILINNKLKRLVWSDGAVVSDTLTEVKDIDLTSVKTLEINNCTCDSKYLDQMFNTLPQLEHVIILGGKIERFQSTFTLRSLKTLQIDLDRFNDIANAFNNIRIEKIMLIDTETSLIPNLGQINLNLLKHFQLQKNKINHSFLKNLLQKAISLHHLDLQGCSNLKVIDNSISFEHIETLNLSNTDLSTDSLITILNNAPDLKRLDLTGCKNISISSELDDLLRGKQVYYPDHIKTEKKKPTYNILNQGNGKGGTSDLRGLLDAKSGGSSKQDDSLKSDDPAKNSEPSKNDGSPQDPITPQDSFSNTTKIDADTDDAPRPPMKLKRIFYPMTPGLATPVPSQYREALYNDVEICDSPCSIDEAFILNKKGDPELVPCDAILSEQDVTIEAQKLIHSVTHHYFYGKKDLNLTQEWQPLPSLSAQERLTHYHFDSDAAEIEIQYSKRDNQYYIRSKENRKTTIDFLLEIPKKSYTLPNVIQQLVEDFIGNNDKPGYESGKLKMENPNPTGKDYLHSIMTERKGACRHRSIVFQHLMKEQFPDIPVRLMGNKVHMQPEVCIDGNWIDCNLGGYPVKEIIDDSNNPANNSIPALKIISDKELFEGDANIVKYLQTWKRVKQQELSIEDYCKHLLEPRQEKKYLIEMANKESNQALLLAIKEYCKKNNKPLFSIDRPDDLTCSAAYLTNQNNKGIINEGPGGPLYNFLKAPYDKNNPPIILINHDTFDPDDIVHHNSLYEDIQKADGTILPPGTIIVALTNISKPNVYLGEDLTSRMDKHEPCPLSDKLLTSAYPELTLKPFEQEGRKSTPINLFNADNWKDILLGQWIINENDLYFEEGALKKALRDNPIINIQNGLWEDDSFKQFWREALINRYIDYEGQRIDLPDQFDFVVQDGYDWDKLNTKVSFVPEFNFKREVLNPERFNLFFSQYQHLEHTKGLKKIPGIIESYAGKTLSVNITREIKEDEWGRFLTECDTHHVTLVYNQQLQLPEPLQGMKNDIKSDAILPWDKSISPLMMIKTTDRDTTVFQLAEQLKDYEFIDVSELEASDLLERLTGSYEKETRRFEFTKVQMTLNKALSANKNIILTGRFSDSLLDSLMPVLSDRANNPNAQGSLALVFNDDIQYNIPDLKSHQVNIDEKMDILKQFHHENHLLALTPQQIKDEDLSQLRARIRYHIRNPQEKDTSKAWDGLYELSSQIKLPPFDLNRSQEKTQEVIEQRIKQMRTMLEQSPLLYLSGLTGVGKTTFITKYFSQLDDVNLYVGEEKLAEFTQDKSDKLKVIFIDEVNIGKREWSEFEGLLLDPQSIVINGEHHLLNKKDKDGTDETKGKYVVIVAGNPLNYGSERQLAPLFERHGNAMVIEPMIGEFIYEEILKPLFEKTSLENNAKDVSEIVLSVYQYLINLSTKEVLISTRELQLMILLTLSYHHQHPNVDFRSIATHYAYQIGKTMVPHEKIKEFEERFKPANSLYPNNSLPFKVKNSNFLITSSRYEIYYFMQDLLNLRHFKQNHCHNDAQKFGGIGGLILEGEPGIGKSEMVSAIFAEHDFSEAFIGEESDNNNVFYRIPISMRNEDKQSLSLKSLEQGAESIIDEGNSAPFLERWYNDILMQINPITKKHPETPGSLLWLTQNPVTMAGRQRPSNALSRRVITYQLPPYTHEEMVSILVNEGLEPTLADKMVSIYVNLVNYAHKNYLTPAPTFRNLLRLARIASNSKQKEALDQFFNTVQIASLRSSILKAENGFRSNTVAALIKYLTPETLELFDLNIGLFDSLIKKSMSEEKVKFMLDFLLFLNKTYGAVDEKQIKYFEQMCELPLEDHPKCTSLNVFFAKKPSSLDHFLARVNPLTFNTLITFIDSYIDYPELVSDALAKEDNGLMSEYLNHATSNLEVLKRYAERHQDAASCYVQLLRVHKLFISYLGLKNIPFSVELIETKPNIIIWISSLIDKQAARLKPENVTGLLTYLTDEDIVIFDLYPQLLHGLSSTSMTGSKIKFSLLLLNRLHQTFSPLDQEQINYFLTLCDLPGKADVQVDQVDLHQIDDFFAKNPTVLKLLTENIKSFIIIEILFDIINGFSGHHELLSHILSDGNLTKYLTTHSITDLLFFSGLCKTYKDKHQESTTGDLIEVLKFALLSYHPGNIAAELINAKPRVVKLLNGCFDEERKLYKFRIAASLLTHLSDDTCGFFEDNRENLIELMHYKIEDARVKFMLDFLSLLDKKLLARDKTKLYFKGLVKALTEVTNYSKILASFIDDLINFDDFLERKPEELDVLIRFIDKYIAFPELINSILKKRNVNNELLMIYIDRSEGYLELLKEYTKHNWAGISYEHVLRVAQFFFNDKSTTLALTNAPPEIILTLSGLLDKNEKAYISGTMSCFLRNINSERIELFKLYPDLLDGLLQKPMEEARVLFLLDFLALLHEKFYPISSEQIEYFKILRDLSIKSHIKYDQMQFKNINDFFTKNPQVFSELFSKVSPTSVENHFLLIDRYHDHPDLICRLFTDESLAKELFDSGLKDGATLTSELIKIYCEKNVDASSSYLDEFLKLGYLLKQVNIQTYPVILANAKARDIKLLAPYVNKEYQFEEDQFVPGTIIYLLEHGREETTELFEQYPDLLKKCLLKNMSEQKVKFLLEFLVILNKSFDINETIRYFDAMRDIQFQNTPDYLNVFFAQNPSAIIHFFSNLHGPHSFKELKILTKRLFKHPDLIIKILSEESFTNAIENSLYSRVFSELAITYYLKHPDASIGCVMDVLKLGYFLTLISETPTEELIRVLSETNSNTIKLVTSSLLRDKNIGVVHPNMIIKLLTYSSNGTTSFFELHPDILDALMKRTYDKREIQFLLHFIDVATKAFNKEEAIKYVTQMIALQIEKSPGDIESLNVLFEKKPKALSHFLLKAKSVPLDALISFVEEFINYPDLIYAILKSSTNNLLLFQEIQNQRTPYLGLVTKYSKKHPEVTSDCLVQVVTLIQFLRRNAPHKFTWNNLITKATPDRINKLHEWLHKYPTDIFINLLYSKADKKVTTTPSAEDFIIKYTKKLLNGSVLGDCFDFSKGFRYSHERAMLLHHLEQETFVSAADDDDETDYPWSKVKNKALLQQAYTNYTAFFTQQAKLQKTKVLLMVSKEFRDVPEARNFPISKKLSDDLSQVLTDYLGSFWIREQRKKSATWLMHTITQENIDYSEILKEISRARQAVFENDTTKEKGMHRFGSSRYYETLNTLEEILVNAWVKDTNEAIVSFKEFLPHYEHSLKHSKQCITEAIEYEYINNKQLYDFNEDLEGCPGYIQALAKEVKMREKTLDKYYRTLGADVKVSLLALSG